MGSEFVVTIPIAAESASHHNPVADSEQPLPRLPQYRILVVDDVPASAKTLCMMLQSLGQQTTMAHDGPAAIECLQTHKPEIVFLDIAMPGMDGYQVAQRLRQQQA